MIKVVGVGMVIVCFGLFGVTKSQTLISRYKTLRTIEKMLFEIMLMLKFNAPTVSEIVEKLEDNKEFSCLSFLKDYKIYEGLTQQGIVNSELLDKEKNLICDVFNSLGASDIESQIEMISFNLDKLRCICDEALEDKRIKCRLYNSLGFLSGILVSIIIV